MKKFVLKVTLKVPDEVTYGEIREYVEDAVSSWGGQYHRSDPLFSANWENAKVKVTRLVEIQVTL